MINDLFEDIPISEVIKERIREAGAEYHASDNIAEYIREGELEQLIDEVRVKFEGVIDSLIIDRINDPNSVETGLRLAKMYINELMSGRYTTPPKATAFPNTGDRKYPGMLVAKAEIKSMCSHHWAPVSGTAYIGVLPGEKCIGLSKYTRIAWHCARRGTLQEELTIDIANAIMKAAEIESCAVYIEAKHGCMECRGVLAHDSTTQTCILHGEFKDPSVKKEFYDNIKLQKSGYRCD